MATAPVTQRQIIREFLFTRETWMKQAQNWLVVARSTGSHIPENTEIPVLAKPLINWGEGAILLANHLSYQQLASNLVSKKIIRDRPKSERNNA
jgi:hypothetical protein